MGVLFFISELLLLVSFILKKKTEKELDTTNFSCLSIILLFCYNTFICYALTFFTIPCKLWILSTINLLITAILTFFIIKKKEIQAYSFKKIDILYILILVIIIFGICLRNFGFPFDINYISADPSHHYLTSFKFAKEETLMPNAEKDLVYGDLSPRKPASYVNSGLLIKCLCDNLEPVSCFYVFAGFGIFTLMLIGITIYTALKKYGKNKEHTFWAFIVALICTLGYPLNSLLFGFEYLTMGLLMIVAIIDMVHYYENNILKLSYIVLIFGLLNFGLFCSYYMFIPFVYPALWIYFYLKNYQKTKKVICKETIILWGVTLLIPFILGYIYHLEPNMYAIIINQFTDSGIIADYASHIVNTGLAVDGFIYINLYSNMLLLVPLPIYLFIKDAKNKKQKDNQFFVLILLLVIVFIEILLIGNKLGQVSIYYLSKNYFALWIILAFINYKALIDIYESGFKYLSRLFIYVYILLMIICTIFSKVKIVEATYNPDENLFSVMEVFGANKTLLKNRYSEYNQKELEIISYAKENLDFNKRIEVIADHRTYYWSYVLLGYTDRDDLFKSNKYWGQKLLEVKWENLTKKIKNDNELDYVIYFNKTRTYKNLKDILFENSEIIYENESGGILKYIK